MVKRNAWGAIVEPAKFKPCPKCTYVHIDRKDCPPQRGARRREINAAVTLTYDDLDASLNAVFDKQNK